CGQIIPSLSFYPGLTRKADIYEIYVENDSFAPASCFKSQPPKPKKNMFKKGQKLEAVDPRHSHIIRPATISNVTPDEPRIMISLNGWSSLNNFEVDYASREIFPVGWCQLVGIHLSKVGENFSYVKIYFVILLIFFSFRSVFEDMSNEIFYEIFEYLGNYHVFEAFFKVNTRFQTLLLDLTIPIKLEIPTICTANLKRYYKNKIIPNKHRINVLHLPDPFIVDMLATPPHLLSTYSGLEILVLDNIGVKSFNEILNNLYMLSNLHTLIIKPGDCGKSLNIFLLKIFNILKLKHLKSEYKFKFYQSPLLYYRDEHHYSTIQLVINAYVPYGSFYSLITNFPELHSLGFEGMSKTIF
ncbi:unnamed protein product, partial [Rotaria sordida]